MRRVFPGFWLAASLLAQAPQSGQNPFNYRFRIFPKPDQKLTVTKTGRSVCAIPLINLLPPAARTRSPDPKIERKPPAPSVLPMKEVQVPAPSCEDLDVAPRFGVRK